MSIRYSYAQIQPQSQQTVSKSQILKSSRSPMSPAKPNCRPEDAVSRDLRVFGGVPEDQYELSDLRGPMLDVVLGLFNGIDYNDEKL